MLDTRLDNLTVARVENMQQRKAKMRSSVIAIIAALSAAPASADGLFMGQDWSAGPNSQARALPATLDPEPRAEDTEGMRMHKLVRVSPQYYAPAYAGRSASDGICDELQPRAQDNIGIIGYKNSRPVHTLYTSGQGSCTSVYYAGFAFWGGEPNMALAPHWDGTPDWSPATFNYMDWLDPRYNPAMRYGG